MNCHRQKSLRVDRVFPEIGRINLVSGARTKAEHRKRDAMLTWLYDTGRLEILRNLKNRQLSINEVYSAHCAGTLGFGHTDVVLKRPLWPQLREWIPVSAPGEATRARNSVTLRFLERLKVLGEAATIADLASVNWLTLLNQRPIGPTGWNHLRRMISRFLTMTLGYKQHPFRHEVLRAFPIAKEPPGRVPDLTPEGFWELLRHVPDPLRPCYVVLVATGMRPGEYLRCRDTDLMPHTRQLRVPGTKTVASSDTITLDEETWRWAEEAIPCPVSYGILQARWKKAAMASGHAGIRLYDLRHCHAQWLANAGVPEALIQQALRHRTPAMTRRYTMQRDKGRNAQEIAKVVFGPAVRPAPVLVPAEERVG